ncbi:MAG: zinc ribbon domain-containing protein [Burkholderiales bacterium]|nr:zinc ribbon domain-containing protein [Burkholderiales bacterium]
MPIYAYRCQNCGFAKDVLQKVSDVPLTDCPSCNQPTFKKQLTAAGFQLKGSGWYVTDFRGGNSSNGGKTGSTESSASSTASDTGTAAASADTSGGKSDPS